MKPEGSLLYMQARNLSLFSDKSNPRSPFLFFNDPFESYRPTYA